MPELLNPDGRGTCVGTVVHVPAGIVTMFVHGLNVAGPSIGASPPQVANGLRAYRDARRADR